MVGHSLWSYIHTTIGTLAASNAMLIRGFRDFQNASVSYSEEGINGGLELSLLVVVRNTCYKREDGHDVGVVMGCSSKRGFQRRKK
jgi:hypothetical protein